MATSMKNRGFATTNVLYVVAFLDFFGVSLIVPLFTGHLKSLGASASLAGFIGSIYGGVQLISAPLIGRWSDRAGRRRILIICTLLSSLGYFMAGLYNSLLMMVLARIPNGIFKHTQEISKAYLADITPDNMHAAVYGKINAAGSMGFILGPVVGGHIAELQFGFNMCCILTGIIFVLNAAIVWAVLPEVAAKNHPDLVRNESTASVQSLSADEITFHPNRLLSSFNQIHWHFIWDIFLYRFLIGFAVLIFRTNFNLMLQYKYDITPKTAGYIISYGSIISTVCSYMVGRIARWYSNDARLLLHTTILAVCVLFSMAYAPSHVVLCILLAPFSLSNAIGRATSIKLTIKKGGKQEVGALLGLSQSVMSIARFLSPLIGGISQEFTSDGPAIVGVFFAAMALCVLCIQPIDRFPTHNKKVQ